ncbi:MAG: glucose-6-phosphate dehydrogenase assembly protein OpcA [Waddliaceae bacterium]
MVYPLIEKYPCRILFIEGIMESDSDVCQTFCLAPSPEQEKFLEKSDRMVIRVSKENLSKAPLLVLPYLIPDLPVFLIWGQDPTKERNILPSFLNVATRLVFDNDSVSNLSEFAKSMLEILDTLDMDLMDVDWAHISGMRAAIGTIFNSETLFNELKSARKISITYTHVANSPMQHQNRRSLYLQGWLAAMLGWKLKKREGDKIQYENHEIILIKEESENGFAGEIKVIDVDQIMHIETLLTAATPLLRVSPSDAPSYQLPIPNMRRGLAFIKEIFYHPITTHYRKTLDIISRMK